MSLLERKFLDFVEDMSPPFDVDFSKKGGRLIDLNVSVESKSDQALYTVVICAYKQLTSINKDFALSSLRLVKSNDEYKLIAKIDDKIKD